MSDPVLLERRDSIALLTMNRPDVLNALDRATLECLIARTDEIRADEGVRAVVLTGAGRAFVAGADISEMRGLSSAEASEFSRLGHRAMDGFESLPMPVIAAVNGFALGGGCELACACDWIYASSRARFGQPEVNLGLIPGFGGTSRLARRVGPGWVRELVMGGEPVKADVALQQHLHEAGFQVQAQMGQVRVVKDYVQPGQIPRSDSGECFVALVDEAPVMGRWVGHQLLKEVSSLRNLIINGRGAVLAAHLAQTRQRDA